MVKIVDQMNYKMNIDSLKANLENTLDQKQYNMYDVFLNIWSTATWEIKYQIDTESHIYWGFNA